MKSKIATSASPLHSAAFVADRDHLKLLVRHHLADINNKDEVRMS